MPNVMFMSNRSTMTFQCSVMLTSLIQCLGENFSTALFNSENPHRIRAIVHESNT